MSTLRQRLGLAQEQDGLSLVEVLVTIFLTSIILTIAGSGIVSALQSQARQVETIDALNDSKMAFERMMRDLRGADPLFAATGSSVTLEIERGAESHRMTYTLAGNVLTVTDENFDTGTTSSRALLDNVSIPAGATLFTYYSRYGAVVTGSTPGEVGRVTARLVVSLPQNDASLDLSDDVTLRNGG